VPEPSNFLAEAEAEMQFPSISAAGFYNGMVAPQIRELMERERALAGRVASLLRELPAERAAEFERSVSEFIDGWLREHKIPA
jgi:hypothetical protein